MALHRDIYWVGRQWAVTGAGIQAVDQKRRRGFPRHYGRRFRWWKACWN
jgi:hypothetical protein